MTEREVLALLCHFLVTKQFVMGEPESIKDMVRRYKSPPFSMVYPIVMRLSTQEYNQLNAILDQAYALLKSADDPTPKTMPELENKPDEPT